MSAASQTPGSSSALPEAVNRETLTRLWGWPMGLGIAWIVLGILALAFVGLTTVASIVALGVLLMIGGIAELVHGFGAARWGGLLWHVMLGLLAGVVGLMLIYNPAAGAAGLTLVAAAYLLIEGLFRGIGALINRYPQWGWSLLGGAISVVLGALLWAGWPYTGLWAIGLFIGIDMIVSGLGLVGVSLGARRLLAFAEPVTTEPTRPGPTDEGEEEERRRAA